MLAGEPAPATAVLEIHATTPPRHELGVSSSLTQIWAFFTGPLDPLPDGCVRVAGSMSGLHDGTITRADNVIIFQNGTEPYLPGELVTVNYRSDIRALGGGETLAGGFSFAFTIASAPATADWSAPGIYETSRIPYFIYGGDVDEDNTPDVVAPNEGTDDVSVFANTGGDGVFSSHLDYGVGDTPSSIFGEDFDNDGDQDLATADIGSGTVSVLLNNGDGSYAPRQVYPAGSNCRQIHGGDFDGDNDVDLCATAYQADVLRVYYNDGDGTFTAAPPITTISDGPFAIRTGDFNLDGHLDIGVACRNTDVLDIFTNNGAGGFSRTGTYPIGAGPWCLNGNDMDGDGDFDLVSVASFSNRLVVLFNNGSGAFPVTHSTVTGSFPLGVYAADFDGDNDIDATSSNYSGGNVGVYMNPGNGLVALAESLPVSVSASYTWAHDLDGDGDLDLSVVDEEADRLFVFYNGAPTAVGGDAPAASLGLRLRPPQPNPTSGSVVLPFSCGECASITAEVVDVQGRAVRRLAAVAAGENAIVWDGRRADGQPAAAGVYYVRVQAETGPVSARRVVLLR
jgi:hypothetical protein